MTSANQNTRTTKNKDEYTYEVLSPYRDETVHAELEDIRDKRVTGEAVWYATFLTLSISALIGLTAATIAGTDQEMNWSAGFTVSGIIDGVYLTGLAVVLVWAAVYGKRRALLSKVQAPDWIAYSYLGGLDDLAAAMLKLTPANLKALRPLWDSAVVANEYLLELETKDGYTHYTPFWGRNAAGNAAKARIDERIDAVKAVHAEETKLEVVALKEASLARHGAENNEDLELAQATVTQLRKDREAREALISA